MLTMAEEAAGQPEAYRESGGQADGGEWTAPWPQSAAEFEALVEAFQHRLVRYAWRRLGCQAEAEDVAQEVFVKAYASRVKLRDVTGVAPYLYRMTANLCTDRRRRPWGRRASVQPLEEAADLADLRPGALERAAASEELRRVDALLSHLPERQAEVLRLCVLDELSFSEIALTLSTPVATVKSRLRYGLAKLRRLITARKEHTS